MSDAIDVSNIQIKVTAEGIDNAVSGLTSLVNVLDKLNNSTSKVVTVNTELKQLSANLNGIGNTLKKGLNIAGLLLAVKAISNLVNKSAEYVTNVNLFNLAMGKYADSAREYAEKVNEVMGIDTSEWMKTQSIFMEMATGFGVATKRAATMSQQLTQLSYDLSAVYSTDVDTAFQKLRSAFGGQTRAIAQWGYDLSKARLQATAVTLGITKQYDAMTQSEKAQLRYYALMTQLTNVQGYMSKTLEQPANQLRIFKMQIEQLGRALGNVFIPILNAVLPYVMALVKAIRLVVEQIAALLGYKLPEMDWGSVADTTGTTADNLDKANANAKKLKKQLAGFDEINNLTTNDSGSGNKTNTGGWVDFDLPTYDFLGEAVQQNIDAIYDKVKAFVPLIASITAAIVAFKTVIFGMKLIENIQSLWALLMANPFATIVAVIAAVIAGLVAWYHTSDTFRAKVDALFKTIKTGLSWLWNNLLKPFITWFGGTFVAAYSNVLKTVGGVMNGLITFIKGTFTGDWKLAWEGVKNIFSSIWEGIKQAFKIPINWIIDGINAFIRGLNRIKIPDWVPVVGGKGFTIQEIPRLATGGIITQPTTAMIGEAGREAVLPLDRNTEWMDAVATKVAVETNTNNAEAIDLMRAILDAVNNMDMHPVVDVREIGEGVNNYNRNKLRIQGV